MCKNRNLTQCKPEYRIIEVIHMKDKEGNKEYLPHITYIALRKKSPSTKKYWYYYCHRHRQRHRHRYRPSRTPRTPRITCRAEEATTGLAEAALQLRSHGRRHQRRWHCRSKRRYGRRRWWGGRHRRSQRRRRRLKRQSRRQQ